MPFSAFREEAFSFSIIVLYITSFLLYILINFYNMAYFLLFSFDCERTKYMLLQRGFNYAYVLVMNGL